MFRSTTLMQTKPKNIAVVQKNGNDFQRVKTFKVSRRRSLKHSWLKRHRCGVHDKSK